MNSFAFAVIAAAETPLAPQDYKPAGWIALGIVLLMCLATVFLLFSFAKHSRKANQPWEGETDRTKRS